MDEKRAREILDKIAERTFVGVDYGSDLGDRGVAVAMQLNPDGTVEVIGHREFYAGHDPIDMQKDPATGRYKS